MSLVEYDRSDRVTINHKANQAKLRATVALPVDPVQIRSVYYE